MSFAKRLKELRGQADLTQQQLAEVVGIPLGTIREYEQGKRLKDPPLSFVAKLAKALGVSTDEFADAIETPAAKGRKKK